MGLLLQRNWGLEMILLTVNDATGEILGRARQESDSTIEITNEMFSRYLSDPSAFIYYHERKEIDLRPDYAAPKLLSLPTHVLETYQTRVQEEIYIPELDVHISISGAFGRTFLAALALAPYVPQKILAFDNGAYSIVEISAKTLPYFANAYAKHFAEILEITNE